MRTRGPENYVDVLFNVKPFGGERFAITINEWASYCFEFPIRKRFEGALEDMADRISLDSFQHRQLYRSGTIPDGLRFWMSDRSAITIDVQHSSPSLDFTVTYYNQPDPVGV